MQYLSFACDYDGTLAHNGEVDDETVWAIEQVRESGRKVILVTGRELPDLLSVFDRVDLFDRVVVENGALLYNPATREERALADPPPEAFVHALMERGVAPLSAGRVIVATWHPNETPVLETIRDLGLELQVVFNKGAVMVLPSSVNKASGLQAALRELGLSPHNTAGIGDAENDHAFLALCECSVAVANALAAVKEHADLVMLGERGLGVIQLIERLIENDLADVPLPRHCVLLGTADGGREIRLPPYGTNILFTGSSGAGKSTVATGFLERVTERGYQVCIIDPEGDYESFQAAAMLGNAQRAPTADEVIELLSDPDTNAAVSLLGIDLKERPAFFATLLPRLQELRGRTGRPHWLVVDEAHHVLPSSWEPAPLTLPQEIEGTMLITVHPDRLAKGCLNATEAIIAVGDAAHEALGTFAQTVGERPPQIDGRPGQGEGLYWKRGSRKPLAVQFAPGRTVRRRHKRKYAEGDLRPDRSFYFRGPEGRLNLRAQNLSVFAQLAEGVDDETWDYHLANHDYSRWFRDAIKDEGLAAEAARAEENGNLPARVSRRRVKEAIDRRYTLPE